MQINGYTLIEPPFKGGMALVYKGEKGSFARAFKFVRPDKAANAPKLVQQFLKEIKLQTSLDHPNVIKILDAYPHQDEREMSFTVLEMEWLNGLDLQRYIEQKAKTGLNESVVEKIALQVLDGLQYAHQHNILHLDIKPSNLFMTMDGHIKIIDFGIARVIGENAAIVDGVEKLTLMTETGESTFRGTIAYASPEQQVGGKLGFYSDIYSFGRVLHFLCTGSTDPSYDVKSNKMAGIIAKCTMQNPKQRYQTCEEVKQAFAEPDKPKLKKCENCGYVGAYDDDYCIKCGHKYGTPVISNCSDVSNQQNVSNASFQNEDGCLTWGAIIFSWILMGGGIICMFSGMSEGLLLFGIGIFIIVVLYFFRQTWFFQK